MQMTFDEYIANPLGKRNAVLSAITRESIRKDYTYRFNNILLRENGKIDYHLYKAKDNSYIIYIKIPSETVKKFYYDVVIRFYLKDNKLLSSTSLNKYQFQVFSNDPAFIYTHAYVFNENGLIFQDLKSKIGKIPLHQVPKVTNPGRTLAYVKSIYFAYLFMSNRGLFKTVTWSAAEKYNKASLLNEVMKAEDKIALRQEEGSKLTKKNQLILDKQSAKQVKRPNSGISDNTREAIVIGTKNSSTVRKTRITKPTKNTKTIAKKF